MRLRLCCLPKEGSGIPGAATARAGQYLGSSDIGNDVAEQRRGKILVT
jgi:hypothetical protein